MTAKDVISATIKPDHLLSMRHVDSELSLLEVLPRLLDAPERMLSVSRQGETIGVIDEVSLLEGLGRLIADRDDSSVIAVECDPAQYSASMLAHAVEDSNAHLVDLISHPGENGKLNVTLRVRSEDPTEAMRNLERYGYSVVEHSNGSDAATSILAERIAALQALINV